MLQNLFYIYYVCVIYQNVWFSMPLLHCQMPQFQSHKHHSWPRETRSRHCASVGMSLGTLSTLTFFLYHHRVKHPYESEKLVNGEGPDSLRCANDLRIPLSIFLHIGTVELSRTSTTSSEALRREWLWARMIWKAGNGVWWLGYGLCWARWCESW